MTAPTPVRLRLSRRRGFNLQAWSREANGLPAVNVARPSKWGNPHRILPGEDPAVAVFLFREDWEARLHGRHREHASETLAELRAHNLACWCALDGDPCHADVLLELANLEPAP